MGTEYEDQLDPETRKIVRRWKALILGSPLPEWVKSMIQVQPCRHGIMSALGLARKPTRNEVLAESAMKAYTQALVKVTQQLTAVPGDIDIDTISVTIEAKFNRD